VLILDTCILTRQRWDSPIWELLRALKEGGTQELAIPELVLFELLAQREREYLEAVSAADKANAALQELQFGVTGRGVYQEPVVPEHHLRAWNGLYRRTFTVLPLTLEAAKEGLRREVYRIRPAKATGKTATGSRDAAIWMAVLEQAQSNPERPVYFVSSNVNDFGHNGILFPNMAEEVDQAGVAVEYLNDLNTVISRFAQKVDVPDDDANTAAQIADLLTRGWLQRTVPQMINVRFSGSVVDFDDEAPLIEWGRFDKWIATPHVEVLSWTDAKRYETGGEATLAATVRVLVVGLAERTEYMTSEALVAFTTDIRVLLGTSSVTTLSVGSTRAATEGVEEERALTVANQWIDDTAASGFGVPAGGELDW
jgi:hypothetical protein